MSTPKVQYGYANGSDNTVRATAVTYPNGRQLDYDYGSASGIDDSISRVAEMVDHTPDQTLVAYSYLGSGTVVEQTSPQPNLLNSLVSLTGSDDPDTGDIYAGLDRFGRVKDSRWRNTSSNTDLSRVLYGYNRASSRTWRENPTDPGRHYDWLYRYDGLQRLADGQRGTLNGPRTAITDPQFGQCWTLDATGNWQQFREDSTGGGWDLIQQRTANPVNEITDIVATTGPTWATPVYDANGNMTTIPRPQAPAPDWANLTADQWDTFTADEWSELEVTNHFAATYDAWNRLVSLSDASGTVQTNRYDGRNFRITTGDYAAGVLTNTRHSYYTDSWQVLEERLDTNSTPDRHFVWGLRYIDDLICRDRSTTGTLNERLYATQDANWNVTALVNTSGAVVERFEYDPYGQTIWLDADYDEIASSNNAWNLTYCGYRWEENAGLFQIRHRWYSPVLGAWVTRDPIGYTAGPNLSCYVSNRPIQAIDGMGLQENPLDPPEGRVQCDSEVIRGNAGSNYNMSVICRENCLCPNGWQLVTDEEELLISIKYSLENAMSPTDFLMQVRAKAQMQCANIRRIIQLRALKKCQDNDDDDENECNRPPRVTPGVRQGGGGGGRRAASSKSMGKCRSMPRSGGRPQSPSPRASGRVPASTPASPVFFSFEILWDIWMPGPDIRA